MNWITDVLIRKKKFFFIICMIGVIGALFVLPFPKFTGNLNGFALENNEDFQNVRELDSLFGGKEKIYLQVTPNTNDRKIVFDAINEISETLKTTLPEVEISSPETFYGKMIRHWQKKDNLLSSFLQEGRKVPILQQLIARDKSSFLIVASLEGHNDSTVYLIDRVIDKKYVGIKNIRALSTLHLEASIKRHVEKDVLVISCLILVFFLGFILMIFRNLLAVLFTFVNIVISLCAAFILFYILGYEINIISILVIPITLILSMSDAIHLLSGYVKHAHILNENDRLRKVISHFIVPSFFSSATTAAAFFSFYLFNESQYIREFGLITSLALMIEFFLTFLIAPFLLHCFNIRIYYDKLLQQLSNFFSKNKKMFSLGFCVLILISFTLIGKLKFNSNTEMFFPLNSEIRKVHDSFKENYYSSIDLQVYVKLKNNHITTSVNDSLYRYTEELTKRFKKEPNVVNVNSATEQFIFKSKLGVPVNLFGQLNNQNPYYNSDKNIYQVQIQFKEAQDIIEFNEQSLNRIINNPPDNIEVLYSSKALLMDAVNESVAFSLLKSLSSSGIVIFLMMFLLSKSLKIAFYSLLPNIAPIAFIVVLYYTLGMHINILTAVTAVFCLGLLDDDTVHIIYRKLWLKEDMGELSFSILSSAILLSIGFLLFMFSSFEPIRVLGWVSTVIFIIGVICEMTIMQLVLDYIKRKK